MKNNKLKIQLNSQLRLPLIKQLKKEEKYLTYLFI